MIVTELETPDKLPSNERHVTCDGPNNTLQEALALIKSRYSGNRINFDRVYYTRSDRRYWFCLRGSQK